MTKHAVFSNQDRGGCLRMHEEQAVMPHAQADNHIELGSSLCQYFRLGDRVANRFVFARMDLLIIPQTDALFRNRAHLTADTEYLELVGKEDLGGDPGFLDEPNAMSNSQSFCTDAASIVHDIFDARPAHVTGGFSLGSSDRQLVQLILLVATLDDLQ